MTPIIWHGCYSDSWQGVIVPDAFAHPAKFARGLIPRIYKHGIERGYWRPGDRIVNPFGGVALGGLDAMRLGLHWTGCELEPRFVALGDANIDKWRRDLAILGDRVGTATLLQGDSRRLAEVVGAGMAAAISSPPYETDQLNGGGRDTGSTVLEAMKAGYGLTPGQLGSMPSGDFAAAITSPPFGEGETRNRSEYAPGFVADMMSRAYTQDRQGADPGNLATLRADDAGFAAAVSSPPYADAVNGTGEGPGARHDPIHHNGNNAHKISSDNGYGATPGQLGALPGDGFQAAVSSPPYESGTVHDDSRSMIRIDEKGGTIGRWGSHARGEMAQGNYGPTPANIGNDTGDTFWSAARVIVEQTYQVLRPGGVAVWVCKDFVRKGQRVPFSDQWEALCEAVGFEPVERIHAMLVEEHGEQLDIFGNGHARRKERKSFFRRLAEKKGSPRIDHEDVLILRKPCNGTPTYEHLDHDRPTVDR